MSNKKNIFKTIFTANNIISACGGCGCGRPKLSQVFEPTPIPKTSSNHPPLSSLSSTTIDDHDHDQIVSSCTSTTIDDGDHHHQQAVETHPMNNFSIPASPCMKINDSVAVVKDSQDPYRDFKHSMLQMIVEKQIDSKEDLQALLKCFLELNSQPYHELILRAFDEIWNEIFSAGRLSISEKTSM
ncbi:hypothetical protein FNV43_RR17732 [Rhamnella rubrinervis]|uniref:Transcription repressor n=1 Tax=Rhamnella rubrinervis TaxID=2594499 RepID=A0A8K0E4B4_9ROSA|nr:hypothetical protein FNV43_RR17732 [Rhamnella rubrinervis]